MISQKLTTPVMMVFINDFPQTRPIRQMFTKVIEHCSFQKLHELIDIVRLHVDVVRPNASLPTVAEGAECYLLGRVFIVRRSVDDARRFATEFQTAGGQVLRCGLGDKAAGESATSENYFVE